MKRKCPICDESGFPTAEAMRRHLGDQHGGARSATLKNVRELPNVQRLVVTLNRNSVMHLEIRDEDYVSDSGEKKSRKQGQQLSYKEVLFQPEGEKPSSSEPAPVRVLRGKEISAPGISPLMPECRVATSPLMPECRVATSPLMPECRVATSPLMPDCSVAISLLMPECKVATSPLMPECRVAISPLPRAYRGAALSSGWPPQDLSELASPIASSTLNRKMSDSREKAVSVLECRKKEKNKHRKRLISASPGTIQDDDGVLKKVTSPSSGKEGLKSQKVCSAPLRGSASPASMKKGKHVKNGDGNVLEELAPPSPGENGEREGSILQDSLLSSDGKVSKRFRRDFQELTLPSSRKKDIDANLERTMKVKEEQSSPSGIKRRKIKEEEGVPQKKASPSSEKKRRKIDEEKKSSPPRKRDSKKAKERLRVGVVFDESKSLLKGQQKATSHPESGQKTSPHCGRQHASRKILRNRIARRHPAPR